MFWVLSLVFGVWCLGFRVQGLGFSVLGSGFRVQGLGFWVLGLGFTQAMAAEATDMQRFRGGLVFKARRLLYHS